MGVRGGRRTHPEEVVPHVDGVLVAVQPENPHRRRGQLGDTASDPGQLSTQQLLFIYGGLKRTQVTLGNGRRLTG